MLLLCYVQLYMEFEWIKLHDRLERIITVAWSLQYRLIIKGVRTSKYWILQTNVFWSPPSKLCLRCVVVSGYVGYFRASKVFLSKPHDTKNPEQARSSAYATITHLLLRTQRVYFIPVCAFSTAPFFYSPLPAAVQDVLVWIYLFLWQYSSKVTLYRRPLLLLIL